MIQTLKKNILAALLVAIALFNILAIPTLAAETEVDLGNITSVSLLSDTGSVVATFSSAAEFEIYMAGPSLMYESCGTGLYQHGQYTYTEEHDVEFTFTNADGTVNSYTMVYVKVYCSSCGALMETYYKAP